MRGHAAFVTTTAALVATFLVVASVGARPADQQTPPPRDAGTPASAPARTGTSSIAGIVTSGGNPGQPLRRVTVTITETVGAYGARMTVTDDAGRFAFDNLPAGRHLVSASKPAYLTTAYGVNRPLRPGSVPTGTAIALEPGQRITDLVIRMTRGGVITGTVRDEHGRPVRDAPVVLLYYRRSGSGERALSTASALSVRTDSRGQYRIFGIPPGEYVALSQLPFGLANMELTTDADVQRVAELRRPGGTVPSSQGNAPRRPTYGYAPVFYPGTSNVADATTLSLGPGEERQNVDFRMQLVPNVRVEGVVTRPDGQVASGMLVWLTSLGTRSGGITLSTTQSQTDADGRFRLTGVFPGSYRLEARPTAGGRGGGAGGLSFWGATEISLSGDADITANLTLQPTTTATGRVVMQSDSGATLDLARVRLTLVADDGPSTTSPAATIGTDGRFTIAPVIPGRYRVVATLPGPAGSGPAWQVKSATMAGQDALDNVVEIRPGVDVADALVTLTDRVSEISGTIQDGAGRPAPEYFIIAFPADRALWRWQSRRILQTRPSSDGRFLFRLPAGEYLIGAVTDVEQNEWFEPAFLETLVPASIKLGLAEGEKKVQHIRLR
jgi:protocatechuate 3,4-dioxygenase beta subunit